MKFTTVLGVDLDHLRQLKLVLPSWRKYRPEIFENPMIVFYDRDQVNPVSVKMMLSDMADLCLLPWPTSAALDLHAYTTSDQSRFGHPQRYRMLAGFVHIPKVAETTYWLKIDTDTVANAGDVPWLDLPFDSRPAIIAHPWGYTKPPNQMLELDEWALRNKIDFKSPPLNLAPRPFADCVSHQRIISWCGFFNTEFTARCSAAAEKSDCGEGRMPVPSQDGFMWYCAARWGLPVARENMKARGWIHCRDTKSIHQAMQKVM